MRKLLTVLVAILLTATVWAQAPQKMSYQAVIHNTNNNLVTNTVIAMKISILQGSTNGTAVYVETQTPTTNSNGLVSLEIGGGTSVFGNFTSIDWANGTYFVKTESDPDGASGGISYTITGTSQLLSVPYALYAANAGTASGGGNFTHYIGEQFGGGVIFHLWKDNAGVEHGLIVDLVDQGPMIWSNTNSSAYDTSANNKWDGLINSNGIINQEGHTNSAAKFCLDLVSNGKNDWYLPSIGELSLLGDNIFNVNKTLSSINGSQVLESLYWSSTNSTGYNASTIFSIAFNRSFSSLAKSSDIYFRAIRRF